MKLWLLRHGEAEAQARSDAQRELTPHGRKEVKQSAEQLPGHGVSKILASPYLRAQQTAQIVREVLANHPPLETINWLTPDGDLAEAVDYLDAHADDNLLLVSHQPFIGELACCSQPAHRQAPLFGDGLGLDSIDALELGLAIKGRYGIVLSAEDENTRRHFASVAALVALVQAQSKGEA